MDDSKTTERVPARALGQVEGDVGVTEQLLGRCPVAGGDADTGGHGDGEILEPGMRTAHGVTRGSARRGLGPATERDPLGQHDELVATQAAHGVVGPQHGDEAVGPPPGGAGPRPHGPASRWRP